MKILFEHRNWRPEAITLINTGTYRVPEEISAELAARAVAEGAAVVVEEAVADPGAATAPDSTAVQASAPPPPRSRRGKPTT